MDATSHPNESEWDAYFGGQLPGIDSPAAAERVGQHLRSCSACAEAAIVRERAYREARPRAHLSPSDASSESEQLFAQSAASIASGLNRHSRFRQVRSVGKGGEATVWEAEDLVLNRRVALKQNRMDGPLSLLDRMRLRREAEALAQLLHPNIVVLFDLLELGDGLVLVMECVDGPTMSALACEKAISIREAVNTVLCLARAVQFAHERGVVHFDLKPDNILLAPVIDRDSPANAPNSRMDRGPYLAQPTIAGMIPKIADFGLTRRLVPAPPNPNGSMHPNDPIIDEWRSVGGSPAFVAPEVAERMLVAMGTAPARSFRWSPPDQRTDVYGLAGLLYFVLAGTAPFEPKDGEPIQTVLQRVVNGTPPSLNGQNCPHIPRDLAAICLKSLATDPNDRYQTAESFANDIVRYQRNEPVVANPPGRLRQTAKWIHRNRWATLVSTTFAIIAAVAFSSAIVADRQRAEAHTQRANAQHATQEKQQALHQSQESLYVESIKRADLEYRSGRIDLMREALNASPPELRRWEWHLLDRFAHPEIRTAWQDQLNDRLAATNGRYIVAVTDEGVQVFDARTGTIHDVSKQSGSSESVASIALHPTQPWLAISQRDDDRQCVTVLWDFIAQKQIGVPIKYKGKAIWSRFTADGALLSISPDERSNFELWDPFTRQHKDINFGRSMVGLALNRDGSRLAAYAGNQRIVVWDTERNQEVRVYDRHEWAPNVLEFHPNGQHVLSASAIVPGLRPAISATMTMDDRHDNRSDVRLWEPDTGKDIFRFPERRATIDAAAFSNDGSFVALAYSDQLVEIWELRNLGTTTPLLRKTIAINTRIRSIRFDPDDPTSLVTIGQTASVWNWQRGGPLFRDDVLPSGRSRSPVFCLSVHANGWIVSGHGDGTIRLRDDMGTLQSQQICFADGPLVAVLGIAAHPTKPWIACTGRRQKVRLFERIAEPGKPPQLRELRSIDLGPDVVEAPRLAFSPDARLLAVACRDGWVRCWDLEDKQEQPILSLHHGAGRIGGLAFRPDGRQLVSGGEEGRVCFWSIAPGRSGIVEEPDAVFAQFTTEVLCLAYSSNGQRLAAARYSPTHSVHIWDAEAGANLVECHGHRLAVTAIAFHPTDPRLVTTSKDHSARLWDARDGRPLLTFSEHVGATTSAMFSADGHRLIVGGWPDTLALWDATPRPPK